MIVTPIKTKKVVAGRGDIFSLLDEYLPKLKDKSVLAITSKVLAICQDRVVPVSSIDKKRLVIQEADHYLPAALSRYDFSFTILHNTLVPMAGIDESNGNGYYVLWPKNPQKSANDIRSYLKKRFGLKRVGVVITDSTALPLHWGTKGIGIRYSGFLPSNNYIGKPDLFGRPLKVSVSNVVDALACAAVLVMGEGSEQTPLATIEDLQFVQFVDRNPTKKELAGFYIEHTKKDMFAPFLGAVKWRRGGRNQ